MKRKGNAKSAETTGLPAASLAACLSPGDGRQAQAGATVGYEAQLWQMADALRAVSPKQG